jgi:rare lipoprotein A
MNPGAQPEMGPPGESVRPIPNPISGRPEVGLASWYGAFHQGLLTASGETYDMGRLTAAHRTLPLGTRLRVTNLDNGRIVRVRVNDRGPYVPGRIVDLSCAAARLLDMVDRGIALVRLEVDRG